MVLLFMRGASRSDAVALMMLVALPFTGVIMVGEAIAGFSNANIVLIAAMFVIGEGLARTGVAQNLGDWLIRRGGSSETRLLVLLMLLVCGLGSVIYSSGVVAIFIPIALRIAQRTGRLAADAGLLCGAVQRHAYPGRRVAQPHRQLRTDA